MKKVLILSLCCLFLVIGLILGACATTTYAEQKSPLKIFFENENGKMQTYLLVDENTGVNYIVVTGQLYQRGIGTAVTPRLNADGTLYTTKQ